MQAMGSRHERASASQRDGRRRHGRAKGIGREIARALALAVAKVAIADLGVTAVRLTAAGLDGEVLGVELDVTNNASLAAFLATTEARMAWPMLAPCSDSGLHTTPGTS